MKSKLLFLSLGFAMFSMFFGSGNLVYPLALGKESGSHFFAASLGILMTGVFVPFLGVFAMMLFKGDPKAFFSCMGEKIAVFWFPLLSLSLMGPFGVLARCITVAHGSFHLFFDQSSLVYFSIGFCIITFFVTANKNRIIPALGSFLTPLLLVSLVAITLFGYIFGNSPQESTQTILSSFQNGFMEGYQTMDLLAAFFFSVFVIKHLESHTELNPQQKFKTFLKATLVGSFLLGSVYFGLVYLGASYAEVLKDVPPQEMLGVVAENALGSFSTLIVCAAIVLACFTTAVILTSLFAEFFHQHVAKEKISLKSSIVVTLLIAFSISTLEFSGIAKFIAPILETIYPALIMMTFLNIFSVFWGLKNMRWPVAMTLLVKLLT
jgi:branched-chain amino acid:cation transporter, LIVCS family